MSHENLDKNKYSSVTALLCRPEWGGGKNPPIIHFANMWCWAVNFTLRPSYRLNILTRTICVLQCRSVLWVNAEVILLTLPVFKRPNPSCSPVTLLNLKNCRYSKHHASSHSTQNIHCRYSNHQPPPCIQDILFKLIIAGIQNTNPHHASSHTNHITHCRYSKYQLPLWIKWI
jgi:hypothetical protein